MNKFKVGDVVLIRDSDKNTSYDSRDFRGKIGTVTQVHKYAGFGRYFYLLDLGDESGIWEDELVKFENKKVANILYGRK